MKTKKKKRISVASAKAKGRNLQNWAAKKISELLDEDYGHEDHHLIEPRPMGQAGTDIILRGQAAKDFPYAIECKSGQHIGWQATVRQARTNIGKYKSWMVFMKTKEFQRPVVMMDAVEFFEMYKQHKYTSELLSKFVDEGI